MDQDTCTCGHHADEHPLCGQCDTCMCPQYRRARKAPPKGGRYPLRTRITSPVDFYDAPRAFAKGTPELLDIDF